MHLITTSTCAIVGGVLTIAGLVDSAIFQSRKRLAGGAGAEGFGGRDGKMVSRLCSSSDWGRGMLIEAAWFASDVNGLLDGNERSVAL
jgi:hypothetical protein